MLLAYCGQLSQHGDRDFRRQSTLEGLYIIENNGGNVQKIQQKIKEKNRAINK